MIWLIIAILTFLILYVIFKPYFIKYNTTLLFTGGLGTGKTLNAVKTGIKIYKKTLLDIKIRNWFRKKINKWIIDKINAKRKKKYTKKLDNGARVIRKDAKFIERLHYYEIPRFITNIPVRIKGGKHEKWSTVLTKDMLMLKERIPEFSIVLIDETPQMINQFNWNEKDVQNNVNEIITFYRHYVGGYFILTAQADSEIVKQIRSKMNTYYHLSNFRKILWKFYKCDVCELIASEVVDNVSIGFYEDNTKTIYGHLFGKHYDSRCFSERYDKCPKTKYKVFNRFKTNKIIRFSKYESPLDDKEET